MTIDKKTAIIIALLVLVGYLIVPQWYPHKTQIVPPLKEPLLTQTTTQISTKPKVSASDPDVEVTQTYTAKVNGETVKVPLKSSAIGSTGVIRQDFDFTPVVSRMAHYIAQKDYKKDWEVSAGVGVESGYTYGLIGVQRNYNKDRAIEVEVHLRTTGVSGGEIKHKWLF